MPVGKSLLLPPLSRVYLFTRIFLLSIFIVYDDDSVSRIEARIRLTSVAVTSYSATTLSMAEIRTTKKVCLRILASFPNPPAEHPSLVVIVPKQRRNATKSFRAVGARVGTSGASYGPRVELRRMQTRS